MQILSSAFQCGGYGRRDLSSYLVLNQFCGSMILQCLNVTTKQTLFDVHFNILYAGKLTINQGMHMR